MKVRIDNRLPAGEPTLVFALTNIFRDLATAINALFDRGLDTKGTLIIDTATTGVIFKDTQGTPHYWRLTVDNAGALVTTDEGTTKPSA